MTQPRRRFRPFRPLRRAALLGLLLAGGLLVAPGPLSPADGPRVLAAQGAVEIGRGEPPVWRPARAGDPLGPGDRVRTGEDGRSELALPAGRVRLYEHSLLQLPAAPDAAGVGIDRGQSLFDVLRRDPAEPFEVQTPEAVVSVKGTRFAVGVSGERVAVSVYRGAVGVRGAAQPRELLVRAGELASGGRGLPFSLESLDGADPWEGFSRGGAAPLFAPRPLAPAPGASRSDGAARAAEAGVDVLAPVREKPGLLGRQMEAAAAQPPAALAPTATRPRADELLAPAEAGAVGVETPSASPAPPRSDASSAAAPKATGLESVEPLSTP